MQLGSITVAQKSGNKIISLESGDLARLPAADAVDVLVVSAFPDDYAPVPGTLIEALAQIGVSVEELASDKDVDLRRFSSCWLSRPLPQGLVAQRILCFEPAYRGRATEVVGDIFRSIVPFAEADSGIKSIAMPIVASGKQGESPTTMLEALVDAATHWLAAGLSLQQIRIVCLPESDLPRLEATFAELSRQFTSREDRRQRSEEYDLFVSYSREDEDAVDRLTDEITKSHPDSRLFVDRLALRPGAAWQQHIYDAIDASGKVVALLTPSYLASTMCKEEYNLALFRQRDAGREILSPIYFRTADLPTYMKLVQYDDAREGDIDGVIASVARLLDTD